MKEFLNKKRVVIAMCITAFFFSLVFFAGFIDTSYGTDSMENKTQSEIESYWRASVSNVGGDEAYKKFSNIVTLLDIDTQHRYAHIFGGVLYEEEGINSFSVCDSNFLYGCVHEFVGEALFDSGVQISDDLNFNCIEKLGESSRFCQHGIGHGLIAYFGYSEESLKQALNICAQLPTLDGNKIGGCYGGVFMEYNLQSMLADDGSVRISENYLEPCASIDDEYMSSCIYWQPQWWRNGPLSSFGTDGEVFKEMGKYCYEITTKRNLIDICFQGIGNIIAPGVDFDTDLSIHMCKEATSSERDNTICRIAAAKRTVDGPGAQVANQICVGLLEYDFKDCFSQVEINSNNKN
ncbi:hypothetical protein HQ403_01885 [Candidatus Kaiserbacteria bacterium]|nr:hypothetical protein [Candidatus Kaiserbacteria bacterium]